MRSCCAELNLLSSYIYGKCANQNCMTLVLVCCSIEADHEGTLYARARVSLVCWEGGSYVVLFMVPLGLSSARSEAHGPSATHITLKASSK